MKFITTAIQGVSIIQPHIFSDERGWFGRTFCKKEFAEHGISADLVQLNQSFNRKRGTFRGMHYQVSPFAEKKLVRCVSGAIVDFVIDLRKDSPTFLKYLEVQISAENMDMILIPEGVAHGFYTLEDRTTLIYHHTEYHNPMSERGLRFDDPQINIPLPGQISIISDRDKNYPLLPLDFSGIELGR